MLTKKIWLLAVPVAIVAIQGCGGGNSLLSPNRTPQPANTPVPGTTPIPTSSPVPGTTPVPNATPVPGTTPAPNPTTAPTPRPTVAPMPGNNTGTFSNVAATNGQNNIDTRIFVPNALNRPLLDGEIQLGGVSTNPNSERVFQITAGNLRSTSPQNFEAGKSYSLNPTATSNSASITYTQTTDRENEPGRRVARTWNPIDGTLIVDAIAETRGNRTPASITFRLVNARFAPTPPIGGSAATPSLPQGTFTFNYSGTAIRSAS